MSKLSQMKEIEQKVLRLRTPLAKERRENKVLPVIGEGDLNADVIFIGEAPGKNEAKTGKPFCGMSGKVLDELLSHIKLDREKVYVTNVVKDRPTDNRDPNKEEIDKYSPFLDKQIEIIKPKVIATLGRFSMEYVMDRYGLEKKTIGEVHGEVFELGNIKFIPLYHPAAAIYNRSKMPELKKDFKTLGKHIK